MPKRTYQVTFTVEVEPETDLDHFQPGLICGTVVGTNWKWVGASVHEVVGNLFSWAFRGQYESAHELMPSYSITPVEVAE